MKQQIYVSVSLIAFTIIFAYGYDCWMERKKAPLIQQMITERLSPRIDDEWFEPKPITVVFSIRDQSASFNCTYRIHKDDHFTVAICNK